MHAEALRDFHLRGVLVKAGTEIDEAPGIVAGMVENGLARALAEPVDAFYKTEGSLPKVPEGTLTYTATATDVTTDVSTGIQPPTNVVEGLMARVKGREKK